MQFNIPTLLTLFRVILIPFFVLVFYLPVTWSPFAAALIFCVAAVTDWFDGFLARRWNQSTRFGAFLDPVADKVLVAIAMVLYLLQITLPEIILSPITYLSDMNTPLPMVVIGYQLSQADFRRALHGASFWVSAALRLVILPLLALGVCMLMRLDSGVTLAVVIAASTPPAALLGMFAAKFDKDVSLAPSLVAVQTLLSMITMPLVLGLAKFLV